jgi:hypothetical protein
MLPWGNWSYTKVKPELPTEKLAGSADNAAEPDIPAFADNGTRRRRRRDLTICLVAVSITLAIIIGIGTFRTQAAIKSSETPSTTNDWLCGNSSAEAISRGCSFDQLAWSWLPDYCPHYANEEFIEAENWKYYFDQHGEAEVGNHDALMKALDSHAQLWTQRREHATHCVFLFLSLGQIIRDGTRYTDKLTRYKHVLHCAQIILETMRDTKGWYDINTAVPDVDFDVDC